MNTVTKIALALLPGDTLLAVEQDKDICEMQIDKVSYSRDSVYISGHWGVLEFGKYVRVVVKY